MVVAWVNSPTPSLTSSLIMGVTGCGVRPAQREEVS